MDWYAEVSSEPWRREATRWLDARVAERGAARIGELEQPHLRPWSTALRAETTIGRVWLKAARPETAVEVRVYPSIARWAPEHVLAPLATDEERGWLLLPDGGVSLADRVAELDEGSATLDVASGYFALLPQYARLQRESQPHVRELLALGVPDARPAAMLARLDEALERAPAVLGALFDAPSRAVHARVAAQRERVARAADALAASGMPAALDHGDLHAANVFVSGSAGSARARFFDWGDCCVTHPYASLGVALGSLGRRLRAPQDDERITRARDAYVEAFTGCAPSPSDLATVSLASKLSSIGRAHAWLRAVAHTTAELEPAFRRAPLTSLEPLLDLEL